MARGLPVIASRVGGTGERITDNMDGLLVEPGDEQALALAIKDLVEHPDGLERLAKAARAKVNEHFTIEECAKQVEQHLQRAIQAVSATEAKQHM
jgi:glycosyltransferase involved in cell wall biosynthesis